MNDVALRDFFRTSAQLAELCTQNGWPDPDTLRVQIVAECADEVTCTVSFQEVLMEGAGCVAGRVDCWGRYRVQLNCDGWVMRADLLAGPRA